MKKHFAIALSYTDDRGNDKVMAIAVSAYNKAEALGAAFMLATKRERQAFVVKAWDISCAAEDVLSVIESDVRCRRKIPAIKLVREMTGMGLREAKDFVEDHWYDWPPYETENV